MASYQLFDALRPEEYEALKADIAKRGVMVPVELDDDGNVLDGHHRLMIADSLGIDCPRVVRHFATEQEKREHVLKLNLLRRHLGPVSWAKAFERLLEARGIERGRGSRNDLATSATVAQVAETELGIPRRTAFHRLQVAEQLEDHPDLAEQVDTGEMHAKRALRVIREREAEVRFKHEPVPEPSGDVDIRHCSVADLLVERGSVDLILTDPPYPAEYLEAWEHLAEFASRSLKAGKLLIAYSGQFHLPEVMYALENELQYVWLGALVTPGAHNQVQQKHVRSAVKPLLFYSNGDYEPGPWFDDGFQSEERQKDDHAWQQSLGAARYYIERLTKPGDLVVDPFLGSGTTAVAAQQLGRSFIGCDVDPKAVDTTKRRLAA